VKDYNIPLPVHLFLILKFCALQRLNQMMGCNVYRNKYEALKIEKMLHYEFMHPTFGLEILLSTTAQLASNCLAQTFQEASRTCASTNYNDIQYEVQGITCKPIRP